MAAGPAAANRQQWLDGTDGRTLDGAIWTTQFCCLRSCDMEYSVSHCALHSVPQYRLKAELVIRASTLVIGYSVRV